MRIQRKARLEKCCVCCLYVYVLLLFVFFLLWSEIADMLLFLLKLSWPKTLVKKWFNMKNKAEDFVSDDIAYRGDWSNFLIWIISIGFLVVENPNKTGIFFTISCSLF